MTYVNRRTRLFLEERDLRPERRRSEGRLKTYPSAEDVRAWCDVVDDRRRHILELVTKDIEKCKKTLVPNEALVELLGGGGGGARGGLPTTARTVRLAAGRAATDGDDAKCASTERHEREAAAIRDLTGTHKIIAKADRPGKIVTKVVGLKPGFKVKPASQGSSRARAVVEGVEAVEAPRRPAGREGVEAAEAASGTPAARHAGKPLDTSPTFTATPGSRPVTPTPSTAPRTVDFAGAAPGTQGASAAQPTERREEQVASPRTKGARAAPPTDGPVDVVASPKTQGARAAPPTERQAEQVASPRTQGARAAPPTERREEPVASPRTQGARPAPPTERREEPIAAPMTLGRPESPPTDRRGEAVAAPRTAPGAERDHRAAQEAFEGEQDVLLNNLRDDNDALRRKLEECLGQLDDLKKVTNVANPAMATSCKDEIDALEHEIKVMRKDNLSPEEEAEVIKREVDVLRRYCLKLKTVEDENERLRGEREEMRRKMAASGAGDCLQEKLDEVTRERDELANKVRKLETELLQYKDLPEDLDVYRDRSRTLDAALAERDELRAQLERMRGLEAEAAELRAKASRLEEAERAAQRRRPDAAAAELELREARSRCRCLEQDVRNANAEKEAMARRIECACAEIERLRPLAKEAELARLERDKLQIRVNELSHLQVHNENLALKCKCLEAAAAERDAYKQRYEEMMAMECECDELRCRAEENECLLRERDGLKRQIRDLEVCIHEQDEEIKRLMCHVEAMAKSKEETQARVRDALASMRAEVEKKDRLIAASEEKLASVQTQLKSSIQGVSCETLCYRTRIEELERELAHAKCLLRKTRAQQGQPAEEIRRELQAAREENEKLQEIAGKMVKITGDEHVQRMLTQSECAVRKVVEELSRQYMEWDRMRGNRNKKGKGCGCVQGKIEAGENCDGARTGEGEKT